MALSIQVQGHKTQRTSCPLPYSQPPRPTQHQPCRFYLLYVHRRWYNTPLTLLVQNSFPIGFPMSSLERYLVQPCLHNTVNWSFSKYKPHTFLKDCSHCFLGPQGKGDRDDYSEVRVHDQRSHGHVKRGCIFSQSFCVTPMLSHTKLVTFPRI